MQLNPSTPKPREKSPYYPFINTNQLTPRSLNFNQSYTYTNLPPCLLLTCFISANQRKELSPPLALSHSLLVFPSRSSTAHITDQPPLRDRLSPLSPIPPASPPPHPFTPKDQIFNSPNHTLSNIIPKTLMKPEVDPPSIPKNLAGITPETWASPPPSH